MSEQSQRRSTEEIQRELDETRQDLGETVEALAAKLDVKQRSTDWARAQVDRNGTELAIGAAIAVALVVGLVLWRRKR